MKAKVLVRVERDVALEAIRMLDDFGVALLEHEDRLPKRLRNRYKDVRRNLLDSLGFWAFCSGVADPSILDRP